jgi:hypothetical protein
MNYQLFSVQPTKKPDFQTAWHPLLLTKSTADQTRWAQIHWDLVVTQAAHHQLAPLLHYRLRAAQLSALPEQDQQLQALARQATVQSLRREHTLRKVLHAFEQAGICPVIVKGAALAYTVYPTPACRSMGDFDLWVAQDVMSRACATLESSHFRGVGPRK